MKVVVRLIVVAVAAGLAACAGPPKPKLDRLYRGLAEPLPRIDPSILSGRRILVDPGHGGYFHGTTGLDSLSESSVNLGVSLYLWGLLREAGADAYLTRSIDRDFLTGDDSSLAADLRTRVTMADSLHPDVFVSIHHNAHPARESSKNSVETYYRAGDPASLDLAFAVHRHLMRNLGIEDGEVRQGNYLILRESKAPAIIGESSYLTHPPAEKKLRLSEIQKLEAEAYFLGILEYFDRGIPRIDRSFAADSVFSSVPTFNFAIADDGGPGIDPDGVKMTLNGKNVCPFLDERVRRVTYRPPWDAPNGNYELTLSVRNMLGNTSEVERLPFVLDFPAAAAMITTIPEYLPRTGGVIQVRAKLVDRRGLAVRDGTPVRVVLSSGNDPIPTEVSQGCIEVPVRVDDGTTSLRVALECGGRRFEHTAEASAASAPPIRALFLRDGRTRIPLLGASVFVGDSLAQNESATGFYFVTIGGAGVTGSVECPGYRPLIFQTDGPDTLEMTPWFEGLLTGRRFVIDPEGGRASEIGKGPLGLSASHVNLQVANYLAGFLRRAGGRVLLARENEEVRTPEDVARLTNRFGADLYVEIRHRVEPADSALTAKTFHFPGSRNGSRAAERVAAAMARRLALPGRRPSDIVTYPLQQTACPAIVVSAPSIAVVEEELRLAESWYQREQAYAVFLGLLDYYAVPDSGTAVVAIEQQNPEGWRITVDGTWTLITGPEGSVTFEALPAGLHRVNAQIHNICTSDEFSIDPGGRAEIKLP